MDIDLSEIEQSLMVVYQKNLSFLKENFFDIFQKVEKLSQDIAEGKVKEEYSLELRGNYFDILNLENNGYYYASNTYTDAEERASFVDFSVKSSFDLLRKVGNLPKLSMPYGLGEIMPVVGFINDKVDLEKIEFQKIMKFVYIGVGLGYHLQEIEKKVQSYTTLIIEPELEIFRLSLFTTDYSIFEEGNRNLFLYIGDDTQEREKVIGDFYNYHNYMNYNIKHYTILKNLSYIKDHIVEYCENNYAGAFPYSSVIENVKRTVSFIRNNDKFLVVNDIVKKEIFEDKEILLISAGPSLDDYMDTIKKYQNRFIIACVDVIVKKLEKHGIVPDIIFSIDPSYLCAEFLTTEDPHYLKNSVIILLSQQHPDVMDILRERKLNYYVSQFTTINKEIGCLGSVPNVGTFGFHVMAHLGGKKLYTIGNDASFHQETGERYSSDSSFTQTETIDIDKKNEDVISREDILEVKGNLREVVKTNRSLLSFRTNYDTVIDNMKPYLEYEAYNLSDGVFIDGLEPMSKEEFIESTMKYDTFEMDYKTKFDSISKELEADCYEDDMRILTSIIQRTKKFQKTKITSRDEFLSKKLDMMIWILEKSKKLTIDVFGNIFLEYTSFIDSYINFVINLRQKGLYSNENLSLLRDHWSKGVIAVFRDMKKAVTIE